MTAAHDYHVIPLIARAARQGRPALLKTVSALTPWLATIAERTHTPDLLTTCSQAIIETARCWP